MDQIPARAVVLAAALPAAFESAVLVQCVETPRLPGLRPSRHAALTPAPLIGAALAEFDNPDAADRLAALLGGLGCAATREVRAGGGRRRYEVHGVLVPGHLRLAASGMLAAAWRQGRQALLSPETLGVSSPRNLQRLALAHLSWRAVLLAGGRRKRADRLWVRLPDQDTAAVLVRAARLLGVSATVTRRPGCLVVTVPASAAPVLTAVPVTAARVLC
ncbi:hypothetical protein [Actinoplanes sp. NBRC 101535]|uniref:hypothetical protein n=1 Tax=Actinoplanes sp. NBRC 101535 TaxID=3032196 RepID=UPI0024A2ECD0|nr:hypothetical protein [Actinoplanes sp. NBRC 101535]GLY03169.1 hypothetical protein Acsp01_35480 [Actinoplanes sp. NBRC 101535]